MSIGLRLTIFNALAIGVILLLLGIGIFFVLRETLLSDVEGTVQTRAETAARDLEIENGSGTNPQVRLEEEAAEQLSLDGVFVIVRDQSGRVLYESVNLPINGGGDDRVWSEVASTGRPASGTADLSREAPDYVYAVPVRNDGGQPLILEAGRSYSSLNETLETVGTALLAGVGLAFLLSLGGAYLLARVALRPVDAIVSSAREMSESDLSRRLPISNEKDEIGRLATTINALLSRLEAAFGRLEVSLKRQEEALARQRRFAADASHEFRTPLTAISGHANMLDSWALEDPKAARKSVRTIKEESERLRSLAEALLALARGDEGPSLHVERYDLREVATDAVESARASANGKVSIVYRHSKTPVTATFDRDQIRQVASILLDNAIKYTPEGGSVSMSVEKRNGRASLSVSDTGPGIPEEELPLVFDRFYRLDASRTEGGAGLGLSIATQIAEAHGGEIEVSSSPGEGSIFTLLIPVRENPQEHSS